jgi:hypothetical protein
MNEFRAKVSLSCFGDEAFEYTWQNENDLSLVSTADFQQYSSDSLQNGSLVIPKYELTAGTKYFFTAKALEPIQDITGSTSLELYMLYTKPIMNLNRVDGDFGASNNLEISVTDSNNPDINPNDSVKQGENPIAYVWSCQLTEENDTTKETVENLPCNIADQDLIGSTLQIEAGTLTASSPNEAGETILRKYTFTVSGTKIKCRSSYCISEDCLNACTGENNQFNCDQLCDIQGGNCLNACE